MCSTDDVPVEASLFHPRMLNGEAHQAFVTVKYEPSRRHEELINKEVYGSMLLQSLLLVGLFGIPFCTR